MRDMSADDQGDVRSQVYWLPKRGNTELEYEDAYAAKSDFKRFALADGATESSFCKQWANLLVYSFVNRQPKQPLTQECDIGDWLTPIQQAWYRAVPWDKLNGMRKVKASQGASASFLGLWLTQAGHERHWEALAIGDTCLFIVRSGRLLVSFPMKRSEEFNSSPNLLCSAPDSLCSSRPALIGENGVCEQDDLIVLATDAISAWFLQEVEAGAHPWERLIALSGQDDFTEWIEALRDTEQVRNDDTTVMIIYPNALASSMEDLKVEGKLS
jgi:hypothetical protein